MPPKESRQTKAAKRQLETVVTKKRRILLHQSGSIAEEVVGSDDSSRSRSSIEVTSDNDDLDSQTDVVTKKQKSHETSDLKTATKVSWDSDELKAGLCFLAKQEQCHLGHTGLSNDKKWQNVTALMSGSKYFGCDIAHNACKKKFSLLLKEFKEANAQGANTSGRTEFKPHESILSQICKEQDNKLDERQVLNEKKLKRENTMLSVETKLIVNKQIDKLPTTPTTTTTMQTQTFTSFEDEVLSVISKASTAFEEKEQARLLLETEKEEKRERERREKDEKIDKQLNALMETQKALLTAVTAMCNNNNNNNNK